MLNALDSFCGWVWPSRIKDERHEHSHLCQRWSGNIQGQMKIFISRTSGGITAPGDFLWLKSPDTAAVIENHVSRFHPEAFRIRAGSVQEWYLLLVSFRLLKRWGYTLLQMTLVILTVFIWRIVLKKWDYFTYHGMGIQRNPTAQQDSCASLRWTWGPWLPHPQTENSRRLDNKYSSQCLNGYQRIVQLQTQSSLKNSNHLCHCNTVQAFQSKLFTFSPSWPTSSLPLSNVPKSAKATDWIHAGGRKQKPLSFKHQLGAQVWFGHAVLSIIDNAF